MKKVKVILSVLLLSCLMLNLPTFAAADNSINDPYIEINTDVRLSHEKLELLKRVWLGLEDEETQNRGNLLCTLFGHSIEKGSMTVIEHLVREEAPRCRESFCTTEICTRSGCDYSNITVENVVYIYCADHS